MKDFLACSFLALLFAVTLFVADQRDRELDSINARMDLIESQIKFGNTPRITVTGRTSIYSSKGEIVMQELPE